MESFKQIAQQLLNEITGMLTMVEQGDFAALVNDLLSAQTVVLSGEGRTHYAMGAFARRLGRMGRKVALMGEATGRLPGKGDVLVVAAYGRGRTLNSSLAEQARKKGAHVFALVAEPSSILASCADHVLALAPSARTPFSIVQSPGQASLLAFNESLLILLDVVLVALQQILKVDPDDVAAAAEED